MSRKDRVKVVLYLTPPQHTRLGSLQENTGADDQAEVIREALKLYEHVVQEYLGGAEILSRSRDGKEATLLYTEQSPSEATTMTDQELEALACEFLDLWTSFKNSPDERVSFQRLPKVKKFIEMGFIASHVNPREGEYAIRHDYTGIAFFTGTGEIAFTEQGLAFAKKCAELYARRECSYMQLDKVIAKYLR